MPCLPLYRLGWLQQRHDCGNSVSAPGGFATASGSVQRRLKPGLTTDDFQPSLQRSRSIRLRLSVFALMQGVDEINPLLSGEWLSQWRQGIVRAKCPRSVTHAPRRDDGPLRHAEGDPIAHASSQGCLARCLLKKRAARLWRCDQGCHAATISLGPSHLKNAAAVRRAIAA